jgi:hypothetical protein
MVSPPDKLGGDVMGDPTRVRVADDGTAVSFGSLQAFGDALGTGLGVDYVAERTGTPGTQGWATHAITPAQQPFSTLGTLAGGWPEYVGDFASDLSAGVFQSLSAVTDAPNVATVKNLYVRGDLRTAASGEYRLLTDAVVPAPAVGVGVNTPGYRPWLAAASDDLTHILFESKLNLTADASGTQVKLYEWDDGASHMVGVLPDGTLATAGCVGGAPCAVAGRGAANVNYTSTTLSANGSRAFFASPVSGFGGLTASSMLYMRDNHGTSSPADDTTIQINASEKTPPDGPSGAIFGGASKDGSRVFFTTNEQLTNDASGGGGDLYMYDATKPDSAPDNLSLISVDSELADAAGVEGVIGVSDDGKYVYFVASQQLVAGQTTAGGDKLYVWHEGTGLRYIGMLTQPNDATVAIGGNYQLHVKTARVAPDGKTLVFTATSGDGLTGYDHGSGCGVGGSDPCSEVYVYRATASGGAGHLACASCNPSGAPATTDASTSMQIGLSAGTPNSHLNQAMEDNGKRVFFTSGDRLVPGDLNTARDVYEYDTDTGELHLISTGKDPSDSYFMAASPTGDDVFFITRQRLTRWDTDTSYDLYDARSPHPDAGFPEPSLPPAACAGTACLGTSGTPAFVAPGSVAFSGSGNASAPAAVGPASRPLTNVQRLRRALKACRRQPKRQRRKCEQRASRRYHARLAGVRRTK